MARDRYMTKNMEAAKDGFLCCMGRMRGVLCGLRV